MFTLVSMLLNVAVKNYSVFFSENAIPTRDVAPREETKQIDWLKFGFLKYPWRCNAGIKLDTTLVNAKLTALECEVEYLTSSTC